MDRLRAAAMFLGVALHAAIPFTADGIPWAIRSDMTHGFFDVLIAAVRGVRMPLFFLIAGFFAREIFIRLGLSGFIRHRLQRIGLPFVVAFICLIPITRWQWDFALPIHAPVHLWFLEYLLIFYAVALLLVSVSAHSGAVASMFTAGRWVFQRAMSLPVWKPALLAFATAPMLWFSPVWGDVEGGAGTSLVPRCRGLLYYGMFFLCGWGFHYGRALLEGMLESISVNVTLALASFLVMQSLLQYRFNPTASDYPLHKFICLYGASLYTWSMLFAALGIFLCWFNKPSPVMRYLADASYWVYLMHMPVVVGLQLWIVPANLGAFWSFICISAAALLVLLPSYHAFVRYTVLGEILNGPRYRTEAAPVEPTAAAPARKAA